MKKRILALLLAGTMMFGLAACSNDSSPDNEDTQTGQTEDNGETEDTGAAGIPEDFTIAYAAVTTSLAPWTIAIANSMQAMCDNNGWELKMYDGMGDVTTQTEQVASIISDDEADLVVLFAADNEVGVTYVEDLTNAGMAVITLGSDVAEAGQSLVTCYVGPDQSAMVGMGAQYIIDKLGADSGANYVILSGFQAQYDYIVREAAVNEHFADTNFNQLAVGYCGASRETAMEYMTNYLTAYDDIDFVFALSDEFALGAIQAIENAGKTGEITVVSLEAFQEGLTAIKDGKMDLTVTMTGASVVEQLETAIKSHYADEELEYYQASPIEAVTIDNVNDITVEY